MMCGLYYFDSLGIFWAFFAAVIVHELGHAMALWALDVPILGLHLCFGGAVIKTGTTDYRRECICALAGPFANLLMILLWRQFPDFCAVGIILALVNLVPIFPLDGGRALRAFLLLHWDERNANRCLKIVQWVVTVALSIFGFCVSFLWQAGIWPLIMTLLLMGRITAANHQECRL